LVLARRSAVPESVRRFGARSRRNKLRLAAPWLAAAGVVLVLAALGAVVVFSPLLAVEEVRVRGTGLVTPDEVTTAAAIRNGVPLARVDTSAVHRRVAALLPVRDVDVRRELTGVVVITVTERTSAAVVERADGRWLLDPSGVPYWPVPQVPPGLVLVKVAAPGPDDPTTRAALTVLSALSPELRDKLTAVAAEGLARIRLELADGRTVIWGDDADSPRKARVTLVMLARPARVIDVSAPDLPTTRPS
jgi:cell division protein FtsQ